MPDNGIVVFVLKAENSPDTALTWYNHSHSTLQFSVLVHRTSPVLTRVRSNLPVPVLTFGYNATRSRLERLGDFKPERSQLDITDTLESNVISIGPETIQELTGLYAVTLGSEDPDEVYGPTVLLRSARY